MEEYFDVYNEAGELTGSATRDECHGNPSLIHKVVHIVVFDRSGTRVLLQKRKNTKKIQPGKWDTAVGGHVRRGESIDRAAHRELQEELGLSAPFFYWFESRIRNEIESENITIFRMVHDGPFAFDKEEIDEVRFFPLEPFKDPKNRERPDFTPNVAFELGRILELLEQEKQAKK